MARLQPAAGLELGLGLRWCMALVVYDEISARLIGGLKYRGARGAVPWLVRALAGRIGAAGVEPEVVTWIPAARHNRRRRGFDQAEILARPLGRRLGLPVRPLLARRPGTGQTGRTRAQRLRGPELVGSRRARARVLVVDDVITTGSTMRAGAAALRAAGATDVFGVAVAHKR